MSQTKKAGIILATMALAMSLQGVASADSIWNDTSTATLFTERRPTFVIGGLITINVNENIAALQRATLIAQKQIRNDHRWQFPRNFATGATQLQGQFRAENQLQSNNLGTTTRNGSILFTITARIEDILPNGNLIITAHKNMPSRNKLFIKRRLIVFWQSIFITCVRVKTVRILLILNGKPAVDHTNSLTR